MRIALPITAVMLGLALPACTTTPEEIAHIRAENDLLKAQIEIIKKNCSYYRDVEIQVEDEAGDDTAP